MRSASAKLAAVALLLAFAGLPVASAADAPVVWNADLNHCRAEFTVSHLIVSKVWGHIPIRSLTMTSARGSVVPLQIDALLDVAHEDTDNHDRDTDLRSATYFDVAEYPTMTFHSTRIVVTGRDDFTVTGDLTIRATTRSVSFPVHVEGRIPDPAGTRVGYSGQLHVDRRDFGIVDARLSPLGVLLVGYDVTIGLTVEALTADPSVHP